jgi:hypothetical protein
MLITDELGRLKRFGDFKEFVAVVECLSDEGNALLRAMEPPAHDDFQHARLSAERQQAGRIGLADLAKWVRDMLKRHAQDPVADVTSLDELADFFGDEQDGASGSKSREEDPLGKLNIRARPLKRKYGSTSGSVMDAEGSGSSDEPTGDGDDEAVGGVGESGTGGTGGGGSNDGSGGTDTDGGGGGGGAKATSSMALKNVRAVVVGLKTRRIAFTPDATGHLRIELEDSGADTNRLLRVASSSLGVVEDGRITQVPCTPGERLVIDVGLEQEFPGTVRVKANAI